MRDETLADARASEKGVSRWELRQQANAAYVSTKKSIEERTNAYIYGTEAMWIEPKKELLELSLVMLAAMISIAGAVGAATAAIFKAVPWAFILVGLASTMKWKFGRVGAAKRVG
jgi:hypothetical protein